MTAKYTRSWKRHGKPPQNQNKQNQRPKKQMESKFLISHDDDIKNSRFNLLLSAYLFLAVIAFGTTGYIVLEDWNFVDSLYMTVVTVSTVGFGEVHPLSPAGRLFTVFLIIFGVGVVAYGIANLAESLFQRQMSFFSPFLKQARTIAKMENHIIICGYGKMGRATIEALLDDDFCNVVLVEKSQAKIDLIDPAHKVPHIVGDATLEHVLQQAGITKARSLVATLDSDADNLFLVLTARSMNSSLKIIARSESDVNRTKFIQAGATKTVSPYAAGAQRVFSLLTASGMNDLTEAIQSDKKVKFKVDTLEIEDGDQFAGKTFAAARLREVLGGLVVAVRRADGSMMFTPQSSTVMHPGDNLYIMKFSERN
eukprot:TRINITY_DN2794_c0_g1_i4.p1 TRINITY_DN2794_c0_g1~~TRINITY_DN2794_c0_g1_i4.p1  ORF type:complete len:368 (-),score=74.11 TRINITY_DN2794_c0_g1_i4:339-1442(-)